MRKVILFMHMSLDGLVCGPNGEQDWMTMDDDAIGEYLLSGVLPNIDTILTGRVLYEGFASFWPTVPANPESPQGLVGFANWMGDTPKIVFSKTLDKADWKNSTIVNGDLAEEVGRLKQQPGKDMIIFGGASTVAAFTRFDLVDEYCIKLEPIVLGKGRRLFDDVSERIKLRLVKSKGFESGVVAQHYETVRI